jgi:hypothetical protein
VSQPPKNHRVVDAFQDGGFFVKVGGKWFRGTGHGERTWSGGFSNNWRCRYSCIEDTTQSCESHSRRGLLAWGSMFEVCSECTNSENSIVPCDGDVHVLVRGCTFFELCFFDKWRRSLQAQCLLAGRTVPLPSKEYYHLTLTLS